MTEDAIDLWDRAKAALHAARANLSIDADTAAWRAYYAGFYAASALFASEGVTFTKHSGVESAVHRDLVKAGRWPQARGADYSDLRKLRQTGDYGGHVRVATSEAVEAVAGAERVLDAVLTLVPALGSVS